ncbi:MAG: MoaD/ThiS family protein [Candidatus Methylomirabilia bacterium]
MKIEVRLFATLAVYLPAGSERGGLILEVPDGSPVRQVVKSLGIPEELPAITLVNGLDADPDQGLRDGDVLSMFPPLAGGR